MFIIIKTSPQSLKEGHKIFRGDVKEIEVAKRLLTCYGFNFIVLPKKPDNLSGKYGNNLL